MRLLKAILYCLLFHMLMPLVAWSQEYTVNVKQYTVEDGLLHRDVQTTFEDRDGFIWVGFPIGIQRFDGKEFKTWSKKADNGNFLNITAIGQEQNGWLWFWNNTLQEFVFMNPVTEEIKSQEERFGNDFPIKRRPDHTGWFDPARQLITDSQGRLIFTSSNPSQLIIYDSDSGFEIIPLKGIESNFIELYFLDSHDRLWVTQNKTGSILHQVNLKGEIIESFDYSESYDVTDFGELNGLLRYKLKINNTHQFYSKEFEKPPIHLFTEKTTSEKSINYKSLKWVITKSGVQVYEKDNNPVIASLPAEGYFKSLYENVSNIYEDSRSRVWISSRWGLSMVEVKSNLFKNYFSFNQEEDRPINNSTRGISVTDEKIYANFEFGGMVEFEKKQPDNWHVIYRGFPYENYLGRPILFNENNEILSGHDKGSLRHILPNGTLNGDFSFRENTKNSSGNLWSFFNDGKQLWIGIDRGLAVKKTGNDFLELIPSNGALKTTGANPTVMHFAPAPDGNLFLCTENGLYIFDPRTKTYLIRYGIEEKGSHYLPASFFYFIHLDSEGIYWLGTNEGLIKWDLKYQTEDTSSYQLFTTLDGLSNDVIYAIFEDKKNRLWLSTDFGIVQFNKKTFEANSYLKNDGISHNEFNRTSAFQEKDGTIYFGGINGITSFHPDAFYEAKKSNPYPLYVTEFQLFDGQKGKLIDLTGKIRQDHTITFRPNDRYFRLEFSLLTFDDVERINYKWKIDGIHDDWNYQKENVLQIGKLPYGNQTLHIKAQDSHGFWSPNEISIDIKVLRPFYLKTWFIILSLCALLGGILFVNKIRTANFKRTKKILETEIAKATSQIQTDKSIIEKQAEELRHLDRTKSRFFANVSHELRTPLTLILGPIGSALKSGTLDNRNFTHLKKAQQSGKELLKLVASILDLSKMENGKLEVDEKPITLFPLLRRISSAFESHAQHSAIDFTFEYHAEKDIKLELDQEKVETILNNLLSNAIKFTSQGGKVSVKTEDLEKVIRLSVADTGRGIHPNDLPYVFDRFYQSGQPDTPTEGGTGIGLALCRELAKVMGGKIWVESILGVGSTFFVELPRREVFGMVEPLATLPQIEKTMVAPSQTHVLAEAPSTVHVSSFTILVVEDNHSLRDYIESILSPYYHVITAENGKTALDILSEKSGVSSGYQSPSMVVSDIMMPIMDGFQFLEKLKSSDSFRHLPVIMLTARADKQDKLRALRIGVDDYLLKPFDEEELLVRIENLLANQRGRNDFLNENEMTEETKTISQEDKLWLDKLEAHVQLHLSDQFSIAQLAKEFAMSESTFRRQLKRLTGLSPVKYVQEFRLSKARQLLETQAYNSVAKVAASVGYADGSTFARLFKSRFGKLPSEY